MNVFKQSNRLMAFSKKEKGFKTKFKFFSKKMNFNVNVTLVHLYYLFWLVVVLFLVVRNLARVLLANLNFLKLKRKF